MKVRRTIIVAMILSLFFTVGYPEKVLSKNVTKAYKKKLHKVIKPFDNYLAYGVERKSTKFKFDNYARTTMLCFKDWKAHGKTFSDMKKIYRKEWKKYFTASVKFKMKKNPFTHGNPKFSPWSNPSYMFQIENGVVTYMNGDWGEIQPKGFVKKITRKGQNRFIVKYEIYWCTYEGEKLDFMGRYQITIKKKSKRYRISNIKRTMVN